MTAPSAERLAYMDFTVSISVLPYAFIQPMPEIHNRYLASVKPFQPVVRFANVFTYKLKRTLYSYDTVAKQKVWYLIIVAGFTTAFVLYVLNCSGKLNSDRLPNTPALSFLRASWFVFSVLMAQGIYNERIHQQFLYHFFFKQGIVYKLVSYQLE